MDHRDEENLNRWLDRTLQQYGNAHPRHGLENRVLANLAERRRLRVRNAWYLTMTAALVAALILAFWLGIETRSHLPQNSGTRVSKDTQINARMLPGQPSLPKASSTKKPTLTRRHDTPIVRASSEPRLSQFPSAQPLSSEERTFAAYAWHFPDQATPMVHDQQKFDEEIVQAELDSKNFAISKKEER